MCNNNALQVFNSLDELSGYLSNEDKCNQYIEFLRWGDNINCVYCGMDKIYRYKSRGLYKCASCGEQFTAKVMTIFEKSKVPLRKWILAMYLNGANKKGISSHQLAREINVSQKTAWFMLHRIRKALEPELNTKLKGVVMSDEAFVGGKNKNRHVDKKVAPSNHRSFKDKVPVLGLLEKDGEVRCFAMADVTNNSIQPLVLKNVEEKSILVTDEWKGYKNIGNKFIHKVCEHRMFKYKSWDGFSTNALEGFWGHLKRTIIGIYHYVTPKHLQRYLDEIAFRYNTRHLKQGERFALTMSKINKRLTYKQLVYGKYAT